MPGTNAADPPAKEEVEVSKEDVLRDINREADEKQGKKVDSNNSSPRRAGNSCARVLSGSSQPPPFRAALAIR